MNREFKADDFLKKYKEKSSNNLSMITADQKLRIAMVVVDQAEVHFPKDQAQREEVLQILYRNFVINAVTILEVFIKDIIQEVVWSEDGYRILLSKAKVNLADAYNLFAKKRVTRNSIIAGYYTFQNMSNISEVFDALTNQSFVRTIREFKLFAGNAPTLVESMKQNHKIDFEDEINRLFSTRHLIIHENAEVKLSHADLNRFVATIQTFIFFMVGYFLSYSWLPEDQRPVAAT